MKLSNYTLFNFAILILITQSSDVLVDRELQDKNPEKGERSVITKNIANLKESDSTVFINNNNVNSNQNFAITSNHISLDNSNRVHTSIVNINSGLKNALKNSVIINDNNNIANVVSSNIIVNNNGATDTYIVQPILLEQNGNSTLIGKNIVKNNRIMSTFINPKFNFLFSDENKDFDVKTKSISNS